MKKIVLCYDFDKTLYKEDVLDHGFCKAINVESDKFWKSKDEFADKYNIEQISAVMLFLINVSKEKNFKLTKEAFLNFGEEVELYNGVIDWFDRIDEYARKLDVEIKHYVISAGMKSSIEGTKIFNKFHDVFACDFLYDDEGIANWPRHIVNKMNKPYYIDKITEDENIDSSNIVYFGDGDTDIPAFEHVSKIGGTSIAIFDTRNKKKDILLEMLDKNKLHYYIDADYSKDSDLEKIIKNLIEKI